MKQDKSKSRKPTRGEKTLCLRVTESKYQEIIDDKAKFKQYLQENFEENPELFPPEIGQGYYFFGSVTSKKQNLTIRKIQLKANYGGCQ